MGLNKIDDIRDYIRYLKQTPGEAEQLYRDVLITVTSFFREPETFEALKTTVFGPLLIPAEKKRELRIWVPGCATGEEAYSIAMALTEYLATASPRISNVKIQRPMIHFSDEF